jgi:hypothetical protein
MYIVAYVYFALRDPDALRSESFALRKMAIQKGIIGDDLMGHVELDARRQRRLQAATESDEDVG